MSEPSRIPEIPVGEAPEFASLPVVRASLEKAQTDIQSLIKGLTTKFSWGNLFSGQWDQLVQDRDLSSKDQALLEALRELQDSVNRSLELCTRAKNIKSTN